MNPLSKLGGDSRFRLGEQCQITLDVEETRVYNPATRKSTKVTVTVPKDLLAEYKERASTLQVSLSEAVTQALRLDSFIESTLKEGGALYIEDKSGKVIKVEIDRS